MAKNHNVIPIPELQRLSALDAIRQQQIEKLLELHERLTDCVKTNSERIKALEKQAAKPAARKGKRPKLLVLRPE